MRRLIGSVRRLSPSAFVILVSLWCVVAAQALAQHPSLMAPPPASQPVVARYTYDITLPDTGKRIAVSALARLVAAPSVDTVVFDLDDAMQVRSVDFVCDDMWETARYVRGPGQVRVAIPNARTQASGYRALQTTCIRIAYEGEPTDGLIISTDAKGRWQAFGDNFPNRARHWLASMDHPSRKSAVTFRVIAPSDRTVMANGRLVEMSPMDGRRTLSVWREDRPIPTYGMVIAVGALTMFDLGRTACGFAEDHGCVPQAVWIAPEVRLTMPGAFARAGDIVAFFARTVGAYPYEKLGHVQSSTRYGGMENPAAIFYYDRGFRAKGGIDDGLIAHETAHQWFGDAVTEREWAHLWLSEGFATFLAALWTQHARGDSAYAAELARARGAVLASTSASSRAVIDSVETDPNRLLNENSYQKGGLVLAMLRQELGDSAFFAGLQRYYLAHRHGNALTDDLQRAVETSAGRPLGWFFDQWLRRPGWAELRTSWAVDRTTGLVTLLVDQEGRFGPYRLQLPIEVVSASGDRTRLTVTVEARRTQAIALPAWVKGPTAIGCDPSHILLAVCSAK
ncbi:MAG: M1 family metallopeptidase [Gemmatimonadota bacterium]|nr:M1 family metallopeptidase [Gemmatimonadota bacterium]